MMNAFLFFSVRLFDEQPEPNNIVYNVMHVRFVWKQNKIISRKIPSLNGITPESSEHVKKLDRYMFASLCCCSFANNFGYRIILQQLFGKCAKNIQNKWTCVRRELWAASWISKFIDVNIMHFLNRS